MAKLFLGKLLTVIAAMSYVTVLPISPSKAEITLSEQQMRTNIAELDTRLFAGKFEVHQVKQQQEENRIRREGLSDQITAYKNNISSIKSGMQSGSARLILELAQVDRQLSQNQARLIAAQQAVRSNLAILKDLGAAAREGAVARVQISRQEQEVNTRKSELEQQIQEEGRLQEEKRRLLSTSRIEAQNQQQRIQEQLKLINQRTSKIKQLDEEWKRLQLTLEQISASNIKAQKQKQRIQEQLKLINQRTSKIK